MPVWVTGPRHNDSIIPAVSLRDHSPACLMVTSSQAARRLEGGNQTPRPPGLKAIGRARRNTWLAAGLLLGVRILNLTSFPLVLFLLVLPLFLNGIKSLVAFRAHILTAIVALVWHV